MKVKAIKYFYLFAILIIFILIYLDLDLLSFPDNDQENPKKSQNWRKICNFSFLEHQFQRTEMCGHDE